MQLPRLLLCLALAACADPAFVPIPLGHLVTGPAHAQAAAVAQLWLPANESLIWDVRAGGMTIGRAELEVSGGEVHSRFHTSALASMFATIQHDLVTTLDRAVGRPRGAIETIIDRGVTTHGEVAFDGTGYTLGAGEHATAPDGTAVHTLHSALGWLRAWAVTAAAPSYLYVVEAGLLFRVDLEKPAREELRGAATIRIEGKLRGADETIGLTLWLTADEARTPIRFAVAAGSFHIVAELVE